MDASFWMQHTQHTATPCNTLQHPARKCITATRNTQWTLTSVRPGMLLEKLVDDRKECVLYWARCIFRCVYTYSDVYMRRYYMRGYYVFICINICWETRRWARGVCAMLSRMYIRMCTYVFRCIYGKVLCVFICINICWETRRWPRGVRAMLSTMYIQMCIYIVDLYVRRCEVFIYVNMCWETHWWPRGVRGVLSTTYLHSNIYIFRRYSALRDTDIFCN